MSFLRHPLWLVGFRPFFLLACLSGALFPLFWVLLFQGSVTPPSTFRVSSIHWHAHEMFFGFGWAALGGFLLTASKNWVGVRGWHGGWLVFLVVAWLLDRVAMAVGGAWPPLLFWSASLLFQGAITLMLLHTLYWQRVRGQESDNYYFWIILPLFLPAKVLLLLPEYYVAGWGMALALFRAVFLIMLERTQVQFMRMAFRVEILRHERLDHAIKILAVALAGVGFLPDRLGGGLEILLALLLFARFCFWHPQRAFTRLDIGVMYLGYLLIVVQLLLAGIGRFVTLSWAGTAPLHLFTLGALGLMLPAMIVRIAKGHTGRAVEFTSLDKAMLWVLTLALAARVVAPQFLPAAYTGWLHLAATCWLVAFGGLLWRYLPYLLAPRVDGREH